MMRIVQKSLRLMLITAVPALAAAAFGPSAYAQCNPVTVLNASNCPLLVCLAPNPPILCAAVPVGGTAVVATPGGPVGVVSQGGFTYFWQAPAPYQFINPSVTISGCCVDLLYDPVACLIKVIPTMFPPPCNP